MKTILAALFLTCAMAHASLLGMAMIKQPVYVHGSDTDVEIAIIDVPIVMLLTAPESTIGAIAQPFIPPATKAWKDPHDVNLTSRYGIKVSAVQETETSMVVTVDAAKAKVPEGYPFTIDQVADAVSTCVKLMSPARPDRKLTVKITPPLASAKQEKDTEKQAPKTKR
ncbi:MAG TPA: hypothetical protein VG796_18120 [Verrucomicrobiales bacterium]|jgi:hypothetical protein|nr:hypothetical protein [Verrucomicrobiales bacterium]